MCVADRKPNTHLKYPIVSLSHNMLPSVLMHSHHKNLILFLIYDSFYEYLFQIFFYQNIYINNFFLKLSN